MYIYIYIYIHIYHIHNIYIYIIMGGELGRACDSLSSEAAHIQQICLFKKKRQVVMYVYIYIYREREI